MATIDVRQTEAAAQSDEVLLLRPGTDAALALAMMHVIIKEGQYHREFVEQHTIGFDELVAHVRAYTPAWAAEVTGIAAERIAALACRYATTSPAMIVLGGSSMHKGPNSWHAGRAISCLPALTGNLGIAGGGFGPRHGSSSHGQALANITAEDQRPPGNYIPNQMEQITKALNQEQARVMLLFGTNMLSSFADTEQVAEGLSRTDLVVSYDLFMNDTTRRYADVILPSTAWLEELGCKATNTHRDIRRLFPNLLFETYRRFIQMIGGASGEQLVLARFAEALGVSEPTVRNYLTIMEGTFLYRTLPAALSTYFTFCYLYTIYCSLWVYRTLPVGSPTFSFPLLAFKLTMPKRAVEGFLSAVKTLSRENDNPELYKLAVNASERL